MTTAEELQVAAVVVAASGFVLRELHSAVLERRRSQPVVIAHEREGPRFSRDHTAWLALAYLTNDGGGSAFNVRFGIEIGGARYPYRLSLDDPAGGNRQRVLGANQRLPEGDAAFPVLLASEEVWGAASRALGKEMWANRVYWARYENTQGRTWETRNPADRSADLDIRRVRLRRVRERLEARKRAAHLGAARELEQRVLSELASKRRDDPPE